MKKIQFPEGFIWGAATAAYQIEGAVHADGRGESIWDRFSHTPGKVDNGDTGDEACRHYEHWKEDFGLLKGLGVGSYRFSIAWPRVIPGGRGGVNEKGLDFYERQVDELLRLGIIPNATLYHWDLPQPLEDKGGWLNRDTAYAYAEYAETVLKRLGDRVKFWATFNEPQIFIGHGYEFGVHAPGRKEGRGSIYQAIHHVMLAHGMGMQAIRRHAPASRAGIAMAPAGIWPASETRADLEACARHWEFSNDWWTLPLLTGKYPARVTAWLGDDAPEIEDGDMETIGQGLDFIGLNYYVPSRTAADAADSRGYKGVPAPENAPRPDFPGWEIFGPGLENLVVQFGRHYPSVDLYVTENGTSLYADRPDAEGRVADPRRVDFLARHIAACERAIARGARLKGYYVWSFMDNFEWGLGYKPRFGLLHVDYQSFKRSPKDSYYWYQRLAKSNAFEFEGADPCPDFDFASSSPTGKAL